MSVEELIQLLKRLADHLRHLEEEQDDHTLHATRYSQTDSRKNNGGPSEPLSIDGLDYTIEEIEDRVKSWCYSLANYYVIGGMPHDERATVWCAWLVKRAKLLLDTNYADQTIEEIRAFEVALRIYIHPQEPHDIDLPEFATVDAIANVLNKTTDAMRKWCERHEITRYVINGRVHYKTAEVTSTNNT